MQQELELRLEEINANKDEETSQVKQRYIQMFNEKAEELHAAKEELGAARKEVKERDEQVRDLQDREEELQNLLSKTQSSLEGEYKDRIDELHREAEDTKKHCSRLETELEATK